MKPKIKNQKLKTCNGFTLVEVLVALALFTILSSIAVGGFIRILRTQKTVAELMIINDNANLTLEQMAREIRTGNNFSKPFATQLRFINVKDQVIVYRLNNGAIERGVGNSFKKITADNVKINNFKINVLENSNYPPRITIGLSVTGTNEYFQNFITNIQTTISARNF
jgi:prepilin-type N-terminal cleavage/methylation domain-containing protein